MNKNVEQYTQDPLAQDMLHDALKGMDSLLEAAENDHASMSESEFKRVLLPVLTNRSGRQSLRIWQDIAGHPMRAIEVRDDRTKERLFIVPPLMEGILPKIPHNQKRMSIYEIIQVAEQKRRVIAGMGDRFLTTQMQDWKPQGSDGDSVLRQWAAILERYNISIGIEAATTPAADTSKKDEDLDLTGEYDDL